MPHGGKREGAGRKSKEEEAKLIEKLSPLDNYAFEALKKGLQQDKNWAVKLYFEYRYGKPKESLDVTSGGESMDFNKLINFGG
jgi:hypothetical protein